MTNEMIKSLKTRRSIRQFKSTPISKEELNTILEVGSYAPTAMGRQSPIMVVVDNEKMIQTLSQLNAEVMGAKTDPFYGAPTVVIVFGDSKSTVGIQDASCVMLNLMNGAHAIGIGSCWINRAKEMFDTPLGKELKQKWRIPDHYEGVANCILGYIEGEIPKAKPRKIDYIRFD